MSNVRLSNGSPTLERPDARVSAASDDERRRHHHPPKPSFCRSLFGPVDHDELQRDLKGHLREMEEAATVKWSFDFARHTPLRLPTTTCGGGRFQWEAVDCKDLPEFYSTTSASLRSSPSTGNNNNSSNSVDLNGNHRHHHSCGVVQQGAGSGRHPPAGGAAGAVVVAAVDGDERCEGQQVDCSEQCRHGQRKRPAACQGG